MDASSHHIWTAAIALTLAGCPDASSDSGDDTDPSVDASGTLEAGSGSTPSGPEDPDDSGIDPDSGPTEGSDSGPDATTGDAPSSDLMTTLTLRANPTAEMGEDELVTAGIPFAHRTMADLQDLQILDEEGVEVQIYAEPLMTYFYKETGSTDVRAAKVQFRADMSGGDRVYTVTNAGRTSADLDEQPRTTAASPSPLHDGLQMPRVFALHEPEHLLASELVPPMGEAGSNAYDDAFFPGVFAEYGALDYATSSFANWQFDRVTALGRQYIRTGDPAYHQELLGSAAFYFGHFTGVGDYDGSTQCAGHFTYKESCDPKYTYVQAAKIYLALTGDDETVPASLVADMVEFTRQKAPAEFAGWQTPYTLGSYITERRIGWRFEASVAGCELLGTESMCSMLPAYVQNMHEHVFANPDTQTPASDGSHRHSWSRHEGDTYPGDDVAADLRFSPWMQVLIGDALWQYWQLLSEGTTRTQVEELLAGHGAALALYGFNRASYDPATLSAVESAYDAVATTYATDPRAQAWACNAAPSPVMAYSATSVYTPALDDPQHFPYATDSHNGEAVTTLALAALFEPDPARRDALLRVADDIVEGFYPNCGSSSNVPRWFGWSTRSAPYPTLQFVRAQLGR